VRAEPDTATQMVAEYPRHEGELLLSADRAHDVASVSHETFRGAQQIRVGVTHVGHTGAARIQPRRAMSAAEARNPPHLSLQSHGGPEYVAIRTADTQLRLFACLRPW